MSSRSGASRSSSATTTKSVPFLGIPARSGIPDSGLGFTGEGVKIAVIDTGIDYTHANFGGPGTEEAYELAEAT